MDRRRVKALLRFRWSVYVGIVFRLFLTAFTGACPQLKFGTLISRLAQSNIQPSLLFFRTSATSRATTRFLHESRIIPPLSYAACVQALEAVRLSTDALEIHFADEEGDPYAVELAGRVGGFVLGNDSDFVTMNSERYLGYIPLDEMVWSVPIPDNDSELAFEVDDDFQEVRKPKAKKKPTQDVKLRLGRGLIPPDVPFTSDLVLSFTAYSPSALASHLKLPVTLLPLLGALVGNDFSSPSVSGSRNAQSLFFERQLTPTQRINHVAATIQGILGFSTTVAEQKRKQKHHEVGSVMDLIDRTVKALLGRWISTMGSGEINAIVERTVESILPYAIPVYEGENLGQEGLWTTEVCALHEPDLCPIMPMLSRMVVAEALAAEEESKELLKRNRLRALYLDAYRKGRLPPKVMDALNTGTHWPRRFLENPDLETVGRSIGRPIRKWVYAILDDAVGLPSMENDDEDRHSQGERSAAGGNDADSDELIDVIEDESDEGGSDNGVDGDPLAPLRGALQRLHVSEDEATGPPKSLLSYTRPPPPPVITEYLRRGTRVAQETVIVPILSVLLSSISSPDFGSQTSTPLLLRSEQERLTIFLRALESDVPLVRDLPLEQLVPALALRWILRIFHNRAEENGSKEREMERWTKREARFFLASFSWATSMSATEPPGISLEAPPIVDRNIQLVAQVLSAIESIQDFSQVLLLSERVPSVVHLFSGRLFHSYLTGVKALGHVVPAELWDVCEFGLESTFGEERRKKSKKAGTDKKQVSPMLARKGTVSNGGFFGLLRDAEA